MKNYRWHITGETVKEIPQPFPGYRISPEILGTALTLKGAIRNAKQELGRLAKKGFSPELYILDTRNNQKINLTGLIRD